MTRESITEIVNTGYPTATGAIYLITGHAPGSSAPVVDIAVFDANFYSLRVKTGWDNGVKINFYELPLNDIERMLYDQFFDPEQVIIRILKCGEIIPLSSYNLLSKLQLKLQPCEIETKVSNFLPALEVAVKMLRLRVSLPQALNKFSFFLVLNEFVNMVYQSEVLQMKTKPEPVGTTAGALYKERPYLIEELANFTISQQTLPVETSQLALASFIDSYLLQLFEKELPLSNCITFDIDYTGFNIAKFFLNFGTKIKADEYLNTLFYRIYLSPELYDKQYKNKISISFTGNENNRMEILKRFIVWAEANLQLAKISILPSLKPVENPETAFLQSFEEVSAAARDLVFNQILKNDDFDAEESTFICIILSAFVLNLLEISAADATNLNLYLSSKWLFSKDEISTIQSNEFFTAAINDRVKIYHSYFLNNKDFIDGCVKKGQSLTNNILPDKDYSITARKLSDWFITNNINFSEWAEPYAVTMDLLSHQFKVQHTQSAIIFSLVFQELANALLLHPRQKLLALFSLSNVFSDQLR